MAQRLNIINEEGVVIGEDTRENIHRNGLLHKETHIWFFTPEGEIIFQRRGMQKDTYPGLLDAAVGGHVEIGMDFEDTAIKEAKEETGLTLTADDLIFLRFVRSNVTDALTGNINNAYKKQFGYKFTGNIKDLRVESDEGTGFEKWKIDDLLILPESKKVLFIPSIVQDETLNLFRNIKELIN